MMAYEGQIAGVGDSQPGKALTNMVIRAMQSASAKEIEERRGEIVAALADVGELEFVNGGGTGSIELTAAEWAVTEIAAGSGFYAPVRFDRYRAFKLRPAAIFALPVTRASGISATEVSRSAAVSAGCALGSAPDWGARLLPRSPGGGALRALRPPLSGHRGDDPRRGPDLPGRGEDLPLVT